MDPETRVREGAPPANSAPAETTADASRPWYHRERSLLIAVASLAISLFTAGERLWVRAEDNTRKQVETLGGTMVALADLQREFYMLTTSGSQAGTVQNYTVSTAFNAKRQLLLREAKSLLRNEDVRERTSPTVFMALGYEELADGHYKEAETLFKQSLDVALREQDELMQVWSRRTLAALYRMRGTNLGDPAQLEGAADQLFVEALKPMESRQDDFGLQTWSETLIFQARMELALGNIEKGRAAAARAKTGIERMFSENPARANLLAVVEPMINGSLTAAPAQPAQAAALQVSRQPAGGSGVETTLAIWAAQPHSATGAEMEVVIDGQPIGRLTNAQGPSRLALGDLSAGPHRFDLRGMSIFMTDATGKHAAVAASSLDCSGAFLVNGQRERSLIVTNTPAGLFCAVQ